MSKLKLNGRPITITIHDSGNENRIAILFAYTSNLDDCPELPEVYNAIEELFTGIDHIHFQHVATDETDGYSKDIYATKENWTEEVEKQLREIL